MMRNHEATNADVVILGSGLAGSIAALCLRRQGLSVVLVDQGTHPRFALGESTTTPSSLWLRVLAARYDVPELLNIATAESIHQHIAPSSGVKTNFGFLYHRPGTDRPERAWQAIIPQAFLSETEQGRDSAYSEMHYFRQDVDAWLWAQALLAGAIGRPATEVRQMAFDDLGVTLQTAAGETLRAAFVIDASGYRSPVAQHLSLRETPTRLRTNSRSLFTHMAGVVPYEQTKLVPDSMARWSQGTLHHFFDGGWMWVIPFNNHRSATNHLCSVGLNLDNQRFPKPEGMSAEAEWRTFLARHPSIARQFDRAVAVRPWVDTGRVQYSSTSCIGDRFWLTSHAAGTVDALYSMGNINTFQTLATGIGLILRCFQDGRFSRERLQPLQELSDRLLRFQDAVVYGNYQGSRSPELLQTWIALWSLTDTARIRKVLVPLVRYVRTGDRRHLDFCVDDAATILTGIGMHTEITDTGTILSELDALCDLMQELEHGKASTADVSQRLNAAAQSRPQYHIDLGAMEEAFARMPWTFKPMADNGLRCHGSCFLTHSEMNSLGITR